MKGRYNFVSVCMGKSKELGRRGGRERLPSISSFMLFDMFLLLRIIPTF